MTSLAAFAPATPLHAERAPASLILRADYIYLYLVLFTASGAVFRYGAINTYIWYALYALSLIHISEPTRPY